MASDAIFYRLIFWGSTPLDHPSYYIQYVDFDHTTLKYLAMAL